MHFIIAFWMLRDLILWDVESALTFIITVSNLAVLALLSPYTSPNP
jgi:hypothetical protein